jgi:hypothetical protein
MHGKSDITHTITMSEDERSALKDALYSVLYAEHPGQDSQKLVAVFRQLLVELG